MSRQLAACTAVSDTFSSRWGEVCCDSWAEKQAWRLGGSATADGGLGLEKAKTSSDEEYTEMNKRKRSAAEIEEPVVQTSRQHVVSGRPAHRWEAAHPTQFYVRFAAVKA